MSRRVRASAVPGLLRLLDEAGDLPYEMTDAAVLAPKALQLREQAERGLPVLLSRDRVGRAREQDVRDGDMFSVRFLTPRWQSGDMSMLWHRMAGDGAGDETTAARRRLLDYNEDDVRATAAVRRWLRSPTFPAIEDLDAAVGP